jgi:hypothetical protein
MMCNSVPTLIAEKVGATSTSPVRKVGSGTSTMIARPAEATTRFTL